MSGVTSTIYLWLFIVPAAIWCILLLSFMPSRLIARCRQLLSLEENIATVALLWLISGVMLVRVIIGALALWSQSDLSLVGVFYPIRIAAPNYGVIAGLPWFALLIGIAIRWPQIVASLAGARQQWLALWLLATGVLVVFAGIQGGLVNGVSGVYTRQEFLDDLAHVDWSRDFFHEHLQRVAGELTPLYVASHSTTHPPLALQILSLAQQLGPFAMGLLTLVLFAGVFPLVAKVATVQRSVDGGIQTALLLLVTPALLIYGGSDDAFYYLLWGVALTLGQIAIAGNRLWIAMVCGGVIALACQLTYASLVLLPAVMAFTAPGPLRNLPEYLRRHAAVLAVLVVSTAASLLLWQWFTGFNLLGGMAQVMQNQQNYLLSTWLVVDPVRGISDRLMTILDFVILAGPVMLLTWVQACKQGKRNPLQWTIAAAAFAVLTTYIALVTPGAGESARGWGGLYLCWWVGCGVRLTQSWSPAIAQRLVQFALCYSAVLQLVVDFGW